MNYEQLQDYSYILMEFIEDEKDKLREIEERYEDHDTSREALENQVMLERAEEYLQDLTAYLSEKQEQISEKGDEK